MIPGSLRSRGQGPIIWDTKWELNFNDPSIEVVDLTNQVAALLSPKESIGKMAADISYELPIPIDKLGIETDMLDGYCKLFGKK